MNIQQAVALGYLESNGPAYDDYDDEDPNVPHFRPTDCECGCVAKDFRSEDFFDYKWHCPCCDKEQED